MPPLVAVTVTSPLSEGRGPTIKAAIDWVTVCCGVLLSVTLIVRELVSMVVGVPEIAQLEFSVNPAGNTPALIEYVYGGLPPPARHEPLKGTPTCAELKLPVRVIIRGDMALTAKLLTAVVVICVGELLSAAFTVNPLVPAVEGTPVMAPLDELSVSPAGKLPALME